MLLQRPAGGGIVSGADTCREFGEQFEDFAALRIAHPLQRLVRRLETFGPGAIGKDYLGGARLLDAKARDVSLKQVDEETAGGYGIYRGTKLQWATLVFSPEAARWVRYEIWHENQKTRDLPEGRFELKVPSLPAENTP